MSYVTNIKVVYGDEASKEPSNAIEMAVGENRDINKNFKGKFVWLVVEKGSGTAVTAIGIDIQEQADKSRDDLAMGAGGDYRYLMLHTGGSRKVVDVQLARSGGSISLEDAQSRGFDAMTIDINKGRGGDYLYLFYKHE